MCLMCYTYIQLAKSPQDCGIATSYKSCDIATTYNNLQRRHLEPGGFRFDHDQTTYQCLPQPIQYLQSTLKLHIKDAQFSASHRGYAMMRQVILSVHSLFRNTCLRVSIHSVHKLREVLYILQKKQNSGLIEPKG